MAYRDPAVGRARDHERFQRRTAERIARGLCMRCGKAPAVEGRSACEPCPEKRRAADRDRYSRGKAAGLPYGGANADAKRRSGRAKSKRRQQARREAGLCIHCGARPPIDGGTTCAPCRDNRQAAERQQYAERRAAGHCTRCGGPVFDETSRCGPCAVRDEASRSPERKNAQSRNRYAGRRARGLCTDCGAPSHGAPPVASPAHGGPTSARTTSAAFRCGPRSSPSSSSPPARTTGPSTARPRSPPVSPSRSSRSTRSRCSRTSRPWRR